MNRYTFKLERNYRGDEAEVVSTFNAETLPDILEEFTAFLRGCQFYINAEDTIELIGKDDVVLSKEEYETLTNTIIND